MDNNKNSQNLSDLYGTNERNDNISNNNVTNQTVSTNSQVVNSFTEGNEILSNPNKINQTTNINSRVNSNMQTNEISAQVNNLNQLQSNNKSNNTSLGVNNSMQSNNTFQNDIGNNINQDLKNESEVNFKNLSSTGTPNTNNDVNSADDEYLKAYIGKNYEKIKSSNISIPAFFFAELYWLYRKMFLFGLILGIVRIIVLNSPLGIFSLGINIICIFITNKIYLINAKYKINKIKSKMIDKSNQEIINACTSKGGTSIGIIVGGIIIEVLAVIVYLFVCLLTGISTIFNTNFLTNLFSDININTVSNSSDTEDTDNGDIYTDAGDTDVTFDGKLYFDVNTNVRDNLSVTVPTIFEDISINKTTYDYTYNSNPDGIFGSCNFSLSVVSNFTDARSLAIAMAKYYNGNTNIIITNINGIEWYGLNYDSVYATTDYLTNLDNKVYLYSFQIGDDSDQTACNTYNEQIFNSIKLK